MARPQTILVEVEEEDMVAVAVDVVEETIVVVLVAALLLSVAHFPMFRVILGVLETKLVPELREIGQEMEVFMVVEVITLTVKMEG